MTHLKINQSRGVFEAPTKPLPENVLSVFSNKYQSKASLKSIEFKRHRQMRASLTKGQVDPILLLRVSQLSIEHRPSEYYPDLFGPSLAMKEFVASLLSGTEPERAITRFLELTHPELADQYYQSQSK